MNHKMLQNLTHFEQAILFLLAFVAVYFVYLAIRDYRTSVNIRRLSGKVRELITGEYTEDIIIEKDKDLADLAEQLNDLSTVFRLAQENLAQEKNRLESILSYMTDGVLATDRSGNIIMINQTAQQQLNIGYEEALQMTIVDILGLEKTYTYHDLVSKTPEIVLSCRDEMGEFITLGIRFALNRRDSGFISGLIAVLHDTTEQEKEERERRLFVSNVSHELRTPLTSVKSYLEALDEGALKEDIAPSFIKVSLDETNRMMRMISDLLNLSRIDNQTVQLEVEMTNFTAFMTSILNRFDQIKSQHTITGKQYEIERDYPIKSIWLEIDPDKMTQVLDNILNNAIKYSPDGGKIKVSMKTTETQLIIAISDEGLGIPKKDLPLIFDRFYRVDKARTRQKGGFGLGLSLGKQIVAVLKGDIQVKDNQPKGTIFEVRF